MTDSSLIDKMAWILLKDRKLLSTRSRGKTACYIPGGKRERGESDLETLRREVLEELQVTVLPGSERLLGIFEAQAHGRAEGVIVRMTCYTADYDGVLHAGAEIEEILWLGFDDASKCSPVDQVIMAWLHDRGMLE